MSEGRGKRNEERGKRYVVANPRGLPAGSWILREGERRWYEGEEYAGPSLEHVIERGLVVEVSDG